MQYPFLFHIYIPIISSQPSFSAFNFEWWWSLSASLTSARESITGLDLANQELLEAIESAQDEISRLSTAGMDLNSKYSRLSTLYKDLEIERDQMVENFCVSFEEIFIV